MEITNSMHHIFLISGSFTSLPDKSALKLAVEGAIATPLAIEDRHSTGKIVPPLNIGQGKVARLRHFLGSAGKEIDLNRSYFYTDSIVDAPVMEMFAHPVAVYPNQKLARLAASHGWLVIGDRLAN